MSQSYNTEVHNEYVVLRNDVILKCSLPSFVADFVSVTAWVDSQANTHHQGDNMGKKEARCFPWSSDILKTFAELFPINSWSEMWNLLGVCVIPSFATDFDPVYLLDDSSGSKFMP